MTELNYRYGQSSDAFNEEQLFESLDISMDKLLEQITEGVIIEDLQGVVRFCNKPFASICGHDREHILGRRLENLAFETNREDMHQRLQTLLSGTQLTTECTLRNNTGSSVNVRLSSVPLIRFDNEPVAILSVSSDITSLEVKEQELAAIKKELENTTRELVCMRNASMLFSDVTRNKDATFFTLVHLIVEAWQYPEITSVRIEYSNQEWATDEFKESPWCQSADIVVGERKMGRIQVCYSEERPEAFSGPFRRQECILIDTLAKELSQYLERKQVEDLKNQQHEELEVYSSLMRHDMINDIQVIVSYLDIIRMRLEIEPQIADYAESALAMSNKMANQLKSYGRGSDAIDTRIARLLRKVAEETYEDYVGIKINLEIAEDAEELDVNSSRLLPAIFENLIRNTVSHTGIKPIIKISLTRSKEMAVIIYMDNGPGVPEHISSKLFQEGVSSSGGGLGLYLSRRVIQAIGGTIELIESKPGWGATFRITLPIL